MKIQKSGFRLIAGGVLLLFLQVSCTSIRNARSDSKVLHAEQALILSGQTTLDTLMPAASPPQDLSLVVDAGHIPEAKPSGTTSNKIKRILPSAKSHNSVSAIHLTKPVQLQQEEAVPASKSPPGVKAVMFGFGGMLLTLVFAAIGWGAGSGGVVAVAALLFVGCALTGLFGTVNLLGWLLSEWNKDASYLGVGSKIGLLISLLGALVLFAGMFMAILYLASVIETELIVGICIYGGPALELIGLIIFLFGRAADLWNSNIQGQQ